MSDVYYVHLSNVLHRARGPRTPTENEQSRRGEPTTACGRKTNKTGAWQALRATPAEVRRRRFCAVCFPDGAPRGSFSLSDKGVKGGVS